MTTLTKIKADDGEASDALGGTSYSQATPRRSPVDCGRAESGGAFPGGEGVPSNPSSGTSSPPTIPSPSPSPSPSPTLDPDVRLPALLSHLSSQSLSIQGPGVVGPGAYHVLPSSNNSSRIGGGGNRGGGQGGRQAEVSVVLATLVTEEHNRRSIAERVRDMVRNAPLVEGAAVVSYHPKGNHPKGKWGGRGRRLLAGTLCLASITAVAVVGTLTAVLMRKRPLDGGKTDRYAVIKSRLEAAGCPPFPIESSIDDGDSPSPRLRALSWLAYEDGRSVPTDDIPALKQRYALALLYFATGGGEGHWVDRYGFLSPLHECEWNKEVEAYRYWLNWWWEAVKQMLLPDAPLFNRKGAMCHNKEGVVDHIWLAENNLTGTLPQEMGLLTGVQHLFLSSNKLEGQFPLSLGNLSQLEYLFFSFNDGMTGTIPSWIGTMESIKEVMLDGTPLEGTLPSSLASLPNLEVLDVGPGCHLNGTIPPFGVEGHSKLRLLSLDFCSFTGTVPSPIFTMPDLEHLHLGGNYLTGTLPSNIGNATKLQTLTLGSSRHPTNNLSGTIPQGISGLSELFFLELSSNQISGTLPDSISQLRNLQYLFLRGNNLEGNISMISELESLVFFSSAQNNLTGDLDVCGMPLLRHSEVDCASKEHRVTCECCNFCCSQELFDRGEGIFGCVPKLP